MRRSGASLRGLPCKKGGCPPLLNCSRPALLLMNRFECGDGCGAMRGIWVSTPSPVQGARALGHVALQWACGGKLREGGREAVWVVRARERKTFGQQRGFVGMRPHGRSGVRVRGAGPEREPGPERRPERVVSAEIPLKFRVQRAGEWLPLLLALCCFNRAALALLLSGLTSLALSLSPVTIALLLVVLVLLQVLSPLIAIFFTALQLCNYRYLPHTGTFTKLLI